MELMVKHTVISLGRANDETRERNKKLEAH
jgi:hypothetical protein